MINKIYTKNEKIQVMKVRVNGSGKEYIGENIRLDSNSDIPITIINDLIPKNINKTVKRFQKCYSWIVSGKCFVGEKGRNILQVTEIFPDEITPDKVLHIDMIISENIT